MEHLGDYFQRFRTSTFRRQLTIIATAAVLAISVVSAVLSSLQGSRMTRQTLIGQGLNLAGSMAEQSRLALLTGAAENAREAVAAALAFPDVLRVEILYPDGRLLFASDGRRSGLTSRPGPAASDGPVLDVDGDEAWRFVAPVRTGIDEGNLFEQGEQRAEVIGYVAVVQGKSTLARLVGQLIAVNIAIGLGFALLFLWLLRLMARRLTRPLSDLAQAMGDAEDGHRGIRAAVAGPRDIVNMAQAFNSMMAALEEREAELRQKNEELTRHAATLEQRVAERTSALSVANDELRRTLESLNAAQQSLVVAEKQASLGRLVAGVAHELNTPLGNAVTVVSALGDYYRQMADVLESGVVRRSDLVRLVERTRDGQELLERSVRRAAEIVQDFKQIAIDQTSEMRRSFDLAQVIEEVLGTVQPSYKHTPYRIVAELEPGIAMDSFPGPLGQVVTNVALNALVHAFPERASGVLEVRCRALDADRVELVMRDDGCGMNDEVLRRIFDPFFTTKLGQGGSGLGLHIVHGIVSGLLGGNIDVASAHGAGSAFRIVIPRVAPASDRREGG